MNVQSQAKFSTNKLDRSLTSLDSYCITLNLVAEGVALRWEYARGGFAATYIILLQQAIMTGPHF